MRRVASGEQRLPTGTSDGGGGRGGGWQAASEDCPQTPVVVAAVRCGWVVSGDRSQKPAAASVVANPRRTTCPSMSLVCIA